MVAAVSRDDSVLAGGISGGRLSAPGRVEVVPVAWLTPSGDWKSIACDADHPAACQEFESDYLEKPHTYTVVSAEGSAAIVRVEKMSLGECFGYGGQGKYYGASISYTALAASSPHIFTAGQPARRVSGQDADPILKAFAATVGRKLDSTKALRVYSLRLEGRDMFVIERAFQNSKPDYAPDRSENHGKAFDLKMIFALGTMQRDRFDLLHWKENVEDENEQILGVIHLKNGSDFLISSVNHPEGQFFRIYGIQNRKLALIYSGGGGSC